MRRLLVDADRFDPLLLDAAVRVVLEGGVIAMPTDTLYGLAADPFRADAVARVFAAKRRDAAYALPLVAADVDQVSACLGQLSELGRRLASRFWPGPLTLIVPASSALAPAVSGGTGTVAVRVPAHPVARALCLACAMPLTATSANISGAPATENPDEVALALEGAVDLLVDAGRTPGGPPSTIVDASGSTAVLLRAGAIAWNQIEECLQRA